MTRRTSFAIAGGIGLAAAYLFLIRPRLAKPADRDVTDYQSLPLKAHELLAGVPPHTLGRVHLPGGRKGMNIAEVHEAVGLAEMDKVEVGAVSKFLFDLRGKVGSVVGWDEVPALQEEITYLSRINDDERRRSLIQPGEVKGISRVLYCFHDEMMLEIVNKTVHCFWSMALKETVDGYDLFNAVYVKRLNWRTPIYMGLISPMLDWVIYPAMDRSILRAWERSFPVGTIDRDPALLSTGSQ